MTAEATIPCFKWADLQPGNPQRDTTVRAFGDAMRDVGFVAIHYPSVTPLVKAAIEAMREYFALPTVEKEKDIHGNFFQTGFTPMGTETGAGGEVPDKKETFFVWREMKSWPAVPAAFQSVMEEYLSTMEGVAKAVIEVFLTYLGECEHLAAMTEGSDHRIRLAYYPTPDPEDDPRMVWAKAHQDLNAFTLLPRPNRSGLELRTKDGKWMPVMCPPDHIIVNSGDQVTMKTAGYIHATEHRVVNNTPEDRAARYATIEFAAFPPGCSLKPFPSCVEKATAGMSAEEKSRHMKKFVDVTAHQFLIGRLIEIGLIAQPTEEQVKESLAIGLCREPAQVLKAKFPHLF